MWRYGSDLRLFLGALGALLLQVGHPTVGAGVRDHSRFEEEPWGRLFRTVDYMNLMVYGGGDAVEVGRRLRGMHRGIRGRLWDGGRYSALEPGAYAWVHATLVWSVVRGQELFGSGIGRGEVEALYREWVGLGRLIGVREGDLPGDWDGFLGYFRGMVQEWLEPNETVERVLRAARRPGVPAGLPGWAGRVWGIVGVPMGHMLSVTGVGMLPAPVRERLGLGWSAAKEREFRVIAAGARGLTPVLPEALRVNGPVYLRARRREIARDEFAPASYRTQ
ncbi:MAG TPA: oxygenase MpaB family protein [Actinophytocola sp.]|uniref:oxygenase MpaB family protein n=1 Tax=Actinophytocola sp. TaxID=1872138 RepID=UPI002DBF511A|nr:oxygenase MpaB family protein [Actinophytocola sp.]HEU5475749.1 oxygenase MpaB family protein [Actinophytocola sp.]